MRGSSLKSFLVSVAALGLAVPVSINAQIVVGAGGLASLQFATTPLPTEFTTGVLNGTGANFNAPGDIDTAVAAVDQVNIVRTLPTSGTVPPSLFSGGMRHNLTGLYLQSRPTTDATNAAGIMVGKFQNMSGGPITVFDISYDFNLFNPVTEDVPGFQVYFSDTGTPGSWVKIPSLSSTIAIGAHSATITPSVAIADTAPFYILWVDDNSDGESDESYTIDNLAITFPGQMPTIVTDPAASTTVNERGTLTLSIVASGATSYQWYHGATALVNGTGCVDGHDKTTNGALSSILTITGVSPGEDAGMYHCRAINISGFDDSADGSVTVTPDMIAPTVLYATCGSNPNEFVIYFSEQMYDSCQPLGFGPVSEIGNWTIEDVGAIGFLGTMGVTNMTPLQTGQTVLGLTTSTPHDPSKAVRISWLQPFTDASAALNVLDVGSVMALCHVQTLVETNQVWKFDDSATSLDGLNPTWYSTAYNDSAWPGEGAGIFDAKRGAAGTPDRCRAVTVNGFTVGTCVNISNALSTITNETVYFRTHFNHSGPPSLAVLQLLEMIDDGAVIYLNGAELTRPNISPGPVNYNTRAPNNVGEAVAVNTTLPGVLLASGDNLLAAELKQNGANSSDYTFGLRVNQLVSTPPLTVSISYDGAGHVTVSWSGGTSAGTLRSTTNITTARPWPVVNGAVSPYTTTSTGPQRFYEVSDP
jgi:hypothetical protein